MTIKWCIQFSLFALFFGFVFYIATNLLTGQQILSVTDVKDGILACVIPVIVAGLYIAYDKGNKAKSNGH